MGKYYEASIIPAVLRRRFDVYDRIAKLGIDLGTREEHVTSLKGRNIAGVIFHESGLAYLSGVGRGDVQMTDDPERILRGHKAGEVCAEHHMRQLHWAIACGGEGGDLNDVLYTVKALGMVVSTDVDFKSAPMVVNGYSKRWHSVFGGGMSEFAQDGLDENGYAGVHARSAIGGFTGRFSLEPEMIVALPPELTRAIIANRGWTFPLVPALAERLEAEAGAHRG